MLTRRVVLQVLTGLGFGSSVFQRSLAALAESQAEITKEMIAQAQWISGVALSDEQQDQLCKAVAENAMRIESLRKVEIAHDVPPAFAFETLAAGRPQVSEINRTVRLTEQNQTILPESVESLAYLPISKLAELVRTRQIRSCDLTNLYLDRLKKYGPMLRCVVNLTESIAMQQAELADREIAQGLYRGPLHGIPWGAKDLMSIPGFPTTWGIPAYRERCLDETATVAERLRDAGAVLVAKLSLGAIAMGDKWFGEMTRNPWNPRQGSSGSSAGSASATVAGCVGFSIGTETLGSIISPCSRCGVTGLRPTFGRVSRHGCMPLSWTMDKVGPICRSVEDCAIVFAAIHGADGRDPTVVNQPFTWPQAVNLNGLRVGVPKRSDGPNDREQDRILRELGCELVEIELPKDYALRALTQIIDIEGSEGFQHFLAAGETEGWNDWPDIFRAAHFVSAIDYVKMMRVRRKLMMEFENVISAVDVLFNCADLVHTNLTGHPSVILPWRMVQRNGVNRPETVTFTGHLFDESRLLSVAHAYQKLASGHLEHPPLDKWLASYDAGTLDEPAPAQNQEQPAGGDAGAKPKDGG